MLKEPIALTQGARGGVFRLYLPKPEWIWMKPEWCALVQKISGESAPGVSPKDAKTCFCNQYNADCRPLIMDLDRF